ncbi:MAG: energy transducer TonB [Rhodospirillales bacterium]|nr:MAG: energy transducer TonB [Rhodospirillales bacterium]
MTPADPSLAGEFSAMATDGGGRDLAPAPATTKPAAAVRPAPSRQAQAPSERPSERQRDRAGHRDGAQPQSDTAAARSEGATDAGDGLAAGAGGTQLAHAGLGAGTAGFAAGPRFRLGAPGNPLPPYPEMARRRGQEGQVVLAVVLAADGTALQVSVADSSGYRLLDQAAAHTVKRWRFTPDHGRGQATVRVPIAFRLTD